MVRSWDELDAKKDEVKGKIVIYNQPWTTTNQCIIELREVIGLLNMVQLLLW